MLRLMLASDNSLADVSDVIESLIQQSSLDQANFFSQLRVIEVDLGTCTLIKSLRALRCPSNYPEESLVGCLTILGASHILWNIAQLIYLMHFGNSSDSTDIAAWQSLSALGISTKRPTSKNDFTLMFSNTKKIHKATIVQAIRYELIFDCLVCCFTNIS